MKYKYSLLLLLSAYFSFAQITMTNLDDNSPILDGDVFNFDKLGSPSTSDAKIKFRINNTSTTETVRAVGEMMSFTNTDGTNCQFCVNPECYFDVSVGQTIPTQPLPIPPSGNNGDFDSFYNSNPGDGLNYPLSYELRFYFIDDNGQQVGDDITITYNYTPENFSTSDFSLADLGINLENTLVTETLNFDTINATSFQIFDLNGRVVNTFNYEAGQHQADISNLSTGHYILSFKDNKNRQSQVRILKK